MSDAASVTKKDLEEVQVEPYRQIARLCLFFEAENKDDYEKIMSFVSTVRNEVQQVEAVVFYWGKLPEPVPGNGSQFLVGKKDFNLFKQKKAALKEWIGAHAFDMLISFAKENRGKSEDIIRNIKARIKVGPNLTVKDPYFHLTIGKPGEKMEFEEFYGQVQYYYSELNINLNQ